MIKVWMFKPHPRNNEFFDDINGENLKMEIDIKPTPELIMELIEEYCSLHPVSCPDDCPFDELGFCIGDNGCNSYLEYKLSKITKQIHKE